MLDNQKYIPCWATFNHLSDIHTVSIMFSLSLSLSQGNSIHVSHMSKIEENEALETAEKSVKIYLVNHRYSPKSFTSSSMWLNNCTSHTNCCCSAGGGSGGCCHHRLPKKTPEYAIPLKFIEAFSKPQSLQSSGILHGSVLVAQSPGVGLAGVCSHHLWCIYQKTSRSSLGRFFFADLINSVSCLFKLASACSKMSQGPLIQWPNKMVEQRWEVTYPSEPHHLSNR